MDLTLSPAQTDLQTSVRRVCKDFYSAKIRHTEGGQQPDSGTGFARERWERMGALGWLGVALPANVHGAGATAIECAIILEEFGRALVDEPYWSCAVMAGHLINQAAQAEVKKSLLVQLTAGKVVFAVAHAENASFDCDAPLTTVAKRIPGGQYEISGHKSMVFGGPVADKLLVSARLGGSGEAEGIFLLNRNNPGLTVRKYRLLDGSAACDLDLLEVLVGADALIGQPEFTRPALECATDQALAGLCAEAVGIVDGVLWTTRDYLRLRRQYGVTLNSFQALQHRMADMFVDVELARSMAMHALRGLAESDSNQRKAAVLAAHVHVAQSGMRVCKEGIQLHGATGVTDQHLVAKYFRRMAVIARLFGGAERQLQRYSGLM